MGSMSFFSQCWALSSHDPNRRTATNPAPQRKSPPASARVSTAVAPLPSFQFEQENPLRSCGTLASGQRASPAARRRTSIPSRSMATSTEPEGAPPAGKGTRGEANRKRSSEQGEGGGGGWQKRKKKKEVFIYGNYKNYYGYRVSAKPLRLCFPSSPPGTSVFTRGRQVFDDMPHSRFRCSWGLGLFCFGLTHDPEKAELASLSA